MHISKFAVGIAALCVLQALVFSLPLWYDSLLYQRSHVLQGQIWRVLTGQWIHITPAHALVNCSVLVLLFLLAAQVMPLTKFWQAMRWTMAGVALALFFVWPHINWYAGMSGFLHGVALAVFVAMYQHSPKLAWLALVGFVAKLVSEWYFGATTDMGFTVVREAHWAGTASGLVWIIFDKVKPRLGL